MPVHGCIGACIWGIGIAVGGSPVGACPIGGYVPGGGVPRGGPRGAPVPLAPLGAAAVDANALGRPWPAPWPDEMTTCDDATMEGTATVDGRLVPAPPVSASQNSGTVWNRAAGSTASARRHITSM